MRLGWCHKTLPVFTVMVLCVLAAPKNACQSDLGCQPWVGGRACQIGQQMDIRLFVNVPNQTNPTVFSFCPYVDQLQAYQLNGTGSSFSDGTTFTVFNRSYLSVYGQGSLIADRTMPQDGDFSRIVYADEHACGNSSHVAVVTYAMVNFTMVGGYYQYPYAPNQTRAMPINVGFTPTCSGGSCLFDSAQICIGPSNLQNCAKCYSPNTIEIAQTHVWASYYGTDSAGAAFTSGQDNPLNFQQFSTNGVYSTVANAL